MENKEGLASDILKELKTQNTRLFVALIVSICVSIAMFIGHLWYISLPIETVRVESTSDGHANYVGNDLNGDINNGESNSSEEGNEITGRQPEAGKTE